MALIFTLNHLKTQISASKRELSELKGISYSAQIQIMFDGGITDTGELHFKDGTSDGFGTYTNNPSYKGLLEHFDADDMWGDKKVTVRKIRELFDAELLTYMQQNDITFWWGSTAHGQDLKVVNLHDSKCKDTFKYGENSDT